MIFKKKLNNFSKFYLEGFVSFRMKFQKSSIFLFSFLFFLFKILLNASISLESFVLKNL